MRLALLSQPANFHCRKWAAALARAGATVYVYSLDEPTDIPGVIVRQIPTILRWRGRYRFPAYWTTARALRHILEADRIDLLHPLGLTPFGLWGLWSGFRPLLPAAIGADVFDFLPSRLMPSGHLHWSATQRSFINYKKIKYNVSKKWYRYWIKKLVQAVDVLTCDNQPLQLALQKGFAARDVLLIRWGIDTSKDVPAATCWPKLAHELNLPLDARLVLAPRGANAFYGADVILRAIYFLLVEKKLKFNHREIHFILLSAGYPVADSIRQFARELEGTSGFRFVGRVLDAHEMQALWTRTDVFISAPAYDGFSAAETEGRWAGALPVLNDIPAHSEWAVPGHNAWVVDPFTPQHVAETLLRLLPQVEKLKPAVRQHNREWIARYADLDEQARLFLNLAHDILHEGHQ